MKLFLTADSHGENLENQNSDNLTLVIGDFSNGNKLRNAIFNGGDMEEAKKDIVNSAKKFINNLPKGSVISPGNIEKPCLEEIKKIAIDSKNLFLDNKFIEIDKVKILGLKFFMEEWWVKQAYPKDQEKINRAKNEELKIKGILKEYPNADIILSHLPPFKILDSDPNKQPYFNNNRPKHCGSKLLLNYIERNQPKLIVCGHIHIPGEKKIGKTKIINPGKGKLIDYDEL